MMTNQFLPGHTRYATIGASSQQRRRCKGWRTGNDKVMPDWQEIEQMLVRNPREFFA